MKKMIRAKVNFDKAKIIMAMNPETHDYIHYLADTDELCSVFLVDRENFVALVENTDESQMMKSLEFFDVFAREQEDIVDAEKLSVYDIYTEPTYLYQVVESIFDASDNEFSRVVFSSLNKEKAQEFKAKQKGDMFSLDVMMLDSARVED